MAISSSRLPVIICGTIFLLIGFLFGGIAAYAWRHEAHTSRGLRAEGATVQGTVLHKSVHVDHSNVNADIRFHISYRFRSSLGTELTDSADVAYRIWQQLKPSGKIDVFYMPRNPAVHRVEGQQQDVMLPIVFGGIGGLFPLIGGLMLLWTLREPPRAVTAMFGGVVRQPFLAFAVLWLIVTVPFFFAGAYLIVAQRSVDAAFKAQTLRAMGQVLTKAVVHSTSHTQNGATRSTSYRVTFRYDAAPGDEIVGSADVNYSVWRQLSERGPIAVRFLADEPWNFRIDGADGGWGSALILFSIGLIGVLIGIGALAVGSTVGRNRSRVAFAGSSSAVPHVRAAAKRARRQTGVVREGEGALAGAAAAALSALPLTLDAGGKRQGWFWVPQGWVLPVVGFVFSIVGLVILRWGVGIFVDEYDYGVHGRLAQGHIVGKTMSRAASASNESTKYTLSYRFTAANGEMVEGSYAATVDVWESLKNGDPVSVRYLSDRPHINREASQDHAIDGIMAIGLGLLFGVVGGGVSVSIAWRAWRLRRLRHSGSLAQGTVLAVEPSWLTINGVRQWQIRFKYCDAAGVEHEASSRSLSPDLVSGLHPGDTGPIRFDPKKPDDCMWGI